MKTATLCLIALALLCGAALADGQQSQTIDSLNVRNIYRWGHGSFQGIALESDSTIWSCLWGTDTLVEIIASDPENIDSNFYTIDSTNRGVIGIVDDSMLIVSGYEAVGWLRTINIKTTPPEIVANYYTDQIGSICNPNIFDSLLITNDLDNPLHEKVFLNISDPTNIDTFTTSFGSWETYGYYAPTHFAKKDSILYGTWIGCDGAPCNWTLYIYVINVADYSNPVLDSVYTFGRSYGDYSESWGDAPCIVVDSFLIVAINNYECLHQCEVFNISTPTHPIYYDSFGGNHGSAELKYQDPYLYAGAYIYDLSGYPGTDSLIGYYVGYRTPYDLIPNGRFYYTLNGLGFEIFEFFEWDSTQVILDNPAPRKTWEDIFLLPNPAYKYANISFPVPSTGEIEIYNILGQRVALRDVIPAKIDYHFDLSGYSVGVYLVTFRSKSELHTKKLIILG